MQEMPLPLPTLILFLPSSVLVSPIESPLLVTAWLAGLRQEGLMWITPRHPVLLDTELKHLTCTERRLQPIASWVVSSCLQVSIQCSACGIIFSVNV